jgi:hypothetical protein
MNRARPAVSSVKRALIISAGSHRWARAFAISSGASARAWGLAWDSGDSFTVVVLRHLPAHSVCQPPLRGNDCIHVARRWSVQAVPPMWSRTSQLQELSTWARLPGHQCLEDAGAPGSLACDAAAKLALRSPAGHARGRSCLGSCQPNHGPRPRFLSELGGGGQAPRGAPSRTGGPKTTSVEAGHKLAGSRRSIRPS